MNGKKKNYKKANLAKDYFGYIFIMPFIIVFVLFALWPIANTFFLSLTDATLFTMQDPNIIGFDNFISLINDDMFRIAFTNTWLLWLGNFVPQMILALVLAAMFASTTFKIKGVGFFKAMYYLPNLLMPVTIAALFQHYLTVHGPINTFLVGTTGILSEPRNFLEIVTDTRITVMFLQTWMWFGQTAIVLVAGMTSISPSFYESAMIDGASQRKMFFSITLPLLKPILLFVLITSLVGGMQMFDIPLLLSDGPLGPPDNAVLTLNMFMNARRTHPANAIGNAAAISVILFFVSSFISIILFRMFREDDGKKRRRKEKTA
ncbi:MAG: sugar ABC transporter permease [Defluviitaleaceae bacterium]|nr:sugar ABC transporter permease [Defluviitaleaceae bacterium]